MNMLNVLLIIGAVFIAGCPLIGCIGGFLRLQSKKYRGDAEEYYILAVFISFLLGILSIIMAMLYDKFGAIVLYIAAAIVIIAILISVFYDFFKKRNTVKTF